MCRTVQAVLSVFICGTQMVVRVIMTFLLLLENFFRLFMQTLYNLISFILQLFSLLPICLVFIVSSRLKCFMCGGGGPCPVNRGGGCDCLMSLMAIIILFFIFRATGVLDKIFYSIGYAKAPTQVARFVPTPGDITECSRNDTEITEYELDYITSTTGMFTESLQDTQSTAFRAADRNIEMQYLGDISTILVYEEVTNLYGIKFNDTTYKEGLEESTWQSLSITKLFKKILRNRNPEGEIETVTGQSKGTSDLADKISTVTMRNTDENTIAVEDIAGLGTVTGTQTLSLNYSNDNFSTILYYFV